VPLRISNINRGNLRAAQFAIDQAEMEFAAAELEIKKEISQAFFAYQGRQRQVIQFERGMLDDARQIYDGVMFMYRNGEVNLLDVLIAQRTFNEVNEMYIETLFEYAAAVVELNRKTGIWDIEF
jgi:cobalt-zinc-cadmium efflux system outer membrane protein